MVKLYPEHLPLSIVHEHRLSAERKVYQSLSQLPDPFVVFYKVNWQVRYTHSGARDGEMDFVVAHPSLGLMILEVKGGEIRYDAKHKQWFSRDRQGIEHEIKDPVDQARDNAFALLRKLNELPGWDKRFLTIGYMIVFPDVAVDHVILRPDLPRELIIDHFDLSNIE